MTEAIRSHRVTAFCNWLDAIDPDPPFHEQPEFRFYADLTPLELEAAQVEMRRRAASDLAEADALREEANRRG